MEWKMPMCKKPKENANVIKGPWKKKSKREIVVPDVDVIALQENIMFADDLTESLLVQMIHTMGENGIDISAKSFIKDISFVVEAVKGSIYRDMGLFHPMSGIMETLTEVTTDEQDTPHGKVNLELIEKISITNDEGEEGPEPA
tara:strand:+ start:89 stop:520 length:432 start_codon:yes stop_codon:yes gene_type:complete